MSYRLHDFSGTLIFNNTPNYELTKAAISVSISLLVMSLALISPVPVHAEANKAESVIFKQNVAKSFRQDTGAFIGTGKNVLEVNLAGIKPGQMPVKDGLEITGFVYSIPSPISAAQLSWELTKGVAVARIRVISDNAKRLRLHITGIEKDSGLKFHLKGNSDKEPLEMIDANSRTTGEMWLPITQGNTVELEIVATDANNLGQLALIVDQVNLLLVGDENVGAAKNSSTPMLMSDGSTIGQKDVVCLSTADNYEAIKNAAAATALMEFVKDGLSWRCSGTLLSDKGKTSTPWFVTASHCINDQKTASDVEFKWLYQAAYCGSMLPDSRYGKTTGGAQLLFTNATYDVSFLQLNKAPAVGAVFVGWDNSESPFFEEVYGIHHPKGDHTMVNRGRIWELLAPYQLEGKQFTLDNILFMDGGVEPTSSGSGLFSTTGYWKGSLTGGTFQNTWYSPFRQYYKDIKPWLGSCSLPWGGSIKDGETTAAYNNTPTTNCNATSEVRTCNDGVLSGNYPNKSCTEIKTDASCQLPWGGTIAHGSNVVAYQNYESSSCANIKEVRACNNGTFSGTNTEPACSTHGGDMILWNDTEGDVFHPGDRYLFYWSDETGSSRKVNITISKNSGKTWTSLKTGLKNTGEWHWKVTKSYISNKVRFRACLPKTKYLRAACDTSDFDIAIKKY